MIRPAAQVAVYVCVAAVDMRKQAASLALLIEQSLGLDVFASALFCFANARRDRVKIVYWERNGLVLWTKRLERPDRFVWPGHTQEATVSMTGRELNALLDGFDVFGRGHREFPVRRVG